MLKEELKNENLGLVIETLGEHNIDKIEKEFELIKGNESMKKCSYIRKTIFEDVDSKTMDTLSIYEDGDILLYLKNSKDKTQYLELSYVDGEVCCINGHIKDELGGNCFIEGSSFNSEIKCSYYDSSCKKILYEILSEDSIEITSYNNEFEYYGIEPSLELISEYFSSIEESIKFAKNLSLMGSQYIETLYDSPKRKKLTF